MTQLPSWIDRLLGSPVSAWTHPLPERATQVDVLGAITQRWKRYQASEIDLTLSPEDDMVASAEAADIEHYRRTGLSALELIVDAMMLARKLDFPHILDLPCGGGRVTRHLVKFFPDAEIAVSDIERKKQTFVASHFGLASLDVPADFSARETGRFDLIFVGSLLTHLNETMFRAATDFFIDALAPGGVLVATTHGRYSATAIPASRRHIARDPIARTVAGPYTRRGFGFRLQERRRYGVNYGTSFSRPSWVARLIEARSDAALLAYKERAWDNHQDALIVQKLP